MELLARGNSNWDYYYDEERKVIYYISKKIGCNNGFFCSMPLLEAGFWIQIFRFLRGKLQYFLRSLC